MKITPDTPSVSDILDAIACAFCNDYCKWPELCGDDEEQLYTQHCDSCPIGKLA